MNFKRLNVLCVLIAFLGLTACQHQPVVKPTEAKLSQAAAAEPTGNPPNLDLAVKTILDWWNLRKAGYPDFKVSPPQRKWESMGEYAHGIRYKALSKDRNAEWFAFTYRDRPNFLEVSMPTQAENVVFFSITIDEDGTARFNEIRFMFPIPGLFDKRLIFDESE